MKRKAFLAAFPYTIPIFAGFWLLGLTYGIYMNVSGFSFWYPMLMSLTIFDGSLGWKKPYLIFGMCDETFSINCTANIPADVNRGWFYFFVTLLNHFYWFSGATIGGLVGSLLQFNTDGLDFVITAMFVVIFVEQWLKENRYISEWGGLAASVGCLLIFGADSFLIPTMICILAALTALRKPLTHGMEAKAE